MQINVQVCRAVTTPDARMATASVTMDTKAIPPMSAAQLARVRILYLVEHINLNETQAF